ncbi:MAG: glycosyltransferase family 4 protein [Sphingomonadaceae bacterium]
MHIVIVTDAWAPQVNGVVRTLQAVRDELEKTGHRISLISPDQFASLPCPTYPEIRLALTTRRRVGAMIDALWPDAVHIATEGPLGVAARRWCLRTGRPFTTAYHTQFPDYVAKRTRLPADWFWRYIAWFHRPASAVLVSTPTIAATLRERGIGRLRPWGRGVDLDNFTPDAPPLPEYESLKRPIHLYVGRVAVEKNIEAFLELDLPGSKLVVGGGPALAELRQRYRSAHFLGPRHGIELASAYAGADVLVFPSRTDTFGLVIVEALACGTPVAAFPVAGPIDLLTDEVGAVDEDLARAAGAALTRDRTACARYGRSFTWQASARQFLDALAPIPDQAGAA